MRNRFRRVVVALGTAALAAVWLTSVAAQAPLGLGQFPAYKTPRLPGTANPDFNGVWQSLTTANWDIQTHEAQPGPFPEMLGAWGAGPPGQGIVDGNEIPYQPWALARRKENFDKRTAPSVPGDRVDPPLGDPELKCWMPGVPRSMYMPYPFQIVQTKDFVLMAHEYTGTTRLIRMNWKEETPLDNTFFMGWNRGRWDGDTLVVDVTGLKDNSWFDRAGNFHSDALHVVERFTAASPYHITYEATIEDPKVFTRPWKISFPLYRRMEKNVQLMEFKCVPFIEELIYGRFTRKPGP